MSADEQVMNMVNGPGEDRAMSAKKSGGSLSRGFLQMARCALLWILTGAVLILLMTCGQIAVWLAASCTCACVVAAAINVDRYFRGSRHG